MRGPGQPRLRKTLALLQGGDEFGLAGLALDLDASGIQPLAENLAREEAQVLNLDDRLLDGHGLGLATLLVGEAETPAELRGLTRTRGEPHSRAGSAEVSVLLGKLCVKHFLSLLTCECI